jgi:hypothetical protein
MFLLPSFQCFCCRQHAHFFSFDIDMLSSFIHELQDRGFVLLSYLALYTNDAWSACDGLLSRPSGVGNIPAADPGASEHWIIQVFELSFFCWSDNLVAPKPCRVSTLMISSFS